jgi:hypothetical protein
MAKLKTYFEQVPIEVVKKIAQSEVLDRGEYPRGTVTANSLLKKTHRSGKMQPRKATGNS